jgi:hypothetical protein
MIGQRFKCVDCGALSPELNADEGSTLISMKYGWRISRRRDPNGEQDVDARCPACWTKRRQSPGAR